MGSYKVFYPYFHVIMNSLGESLYLSSVSIINRCYHMSFSFIDFVTNNPWGIILFPFAASIIGNLLYDAIKRIASSSSKSVKKQRIRQRILRANNLFAESYKAGYAQSHSTLHQNLFVGGYIIEIVFKVFVILLIALGTGLLLFLLRDYSWAFVSILGISCATLTISIKRLFEVIKVFKEVTHIVFGEDYYTREKDLITRYWKLKKQGMKDEDIFKSLESFSQKD